MSSKTRRSLLLYIFVYSSFRIMFLAFPMWRGPEGKGASLIVTFPWVAFSRGFSPSLISRLEVLDSNDSNSFCCCSGVMLFTFLIIC